MQYFAGTKPGRAWMNAHLAAWLNEQPRSNFYIEGRDEFRPLVVAGVRGVIGIYLDRSYTAAAIRIRAEKPEMLDGERFNYAHTERDIPDILRPHGKMQPMSDAEIIEDINDIDFALRAIESGHEIVVDTTSLSVEQVSNFMMALAV
jgi:hypothetical protein